MSQSELKSIIDKDKKYYLNTFGDRSPVAFSHGKGVYLYGTDHKRYMDLLGGIAVNALGHNHPRLVAAIACQARCLVHCSNLYYIGAQADLAEALVERSFADKAFFCNSGAEANEGAIKIARAYHYKRGAPRAKIVTALQSFHGRTLATVTATGQEKYQKPFAPLPEGFVHVPFNDIAAMSEVVDGDTCAVMLELIQGESGVIPIDPVFLRQTADLCKKHGCLLIFDEVQTGVGRTGKLYAYEHFGVTPDILTSAKGLAGGVPIGAVLVTNDVAEAIQPGDHGTTFGGNPLATAAALAVLQEIEESDLLSGVEEVGAYLRDKLAVLQKKSGKIADVRGQGLLVGIELAEPSAVKVKADLLDAGFLVGSIGDRTLRLAPPLILKKSHVNSFIIALKNVL